MERSLRGRGGVVPGRVLSAWGGAGVDGRGQGRGEGGSGEPGR
ncbi:hypothetical protein ACFWNR_05865 [Streptomyces virginiae]